MAESTNRKGRNKLFWLVTVFCISISQSSPAIAVTKADENKLSVIEKKLFFKNYPEEALDKRIARIEKKFFGEPSSGSVDERLAKVFEVAGPQVDADGTVTRGNMTEPEKPAEKEPSAGPTKSSSPSVPKVDDAEAAWEQANINAVNARDAEINTLLKEGIKLWKRKEAESAMEKFTQVVRLDPQNAEAFFSLGVVHEAKGQFQEADAAYRHAHDINPDRMDYKDAIVSLEQKLGKKQELDSKQEELNKEVQEAAEAFKRKEYLSAVELYKRLEEKSPKNAGYKYNIGTIYLMMKSPIQALEYYEKAKKLNPKEERYVSAVEKLKEVIGKDEDKRNAAEALWDQKEKDDKKREKEKEKAKKDASRGGNKGPQKANKPQGGGRQQNLAPGFNGPGTAVFPNQQQQQRPPVQRMPQQQMPPGQWNPQAGFATDQGGGQQASFNPQAPSGFPQQQNFPPQGGNMQQGSNFPQQGSNFNQQNFPPQGNFQPQNSPQQGFPPQQNFQQPNFPQQGFPPQQNFPQQGGSNFPQQGFPPQGNFQQNPQQQGFPQGNMQQQNFPQQGGNFGGMNQGGNQGGISGLTQPDYQQQVNQGFQQNPGNTGYSTTPQHPVSAAKTLGANALNMLGIIAAPSPQGVMITTIGIGSRAAKAGLNKGDIVVSVDGVNIQGINQMTSILSRKHEGESALLVVNRKGKFNQVAL